MSKAQRPARSINILDFDAVELPHCCGVLDIGSFTVNVENIPACPANAPWEFDGLRQRPTWWTDVSTDDAKSRYDDHVEEAEEAAKDVVGLDESGTGLFTATFIDNEACRAAYAHLTKEHTLLFQSKPRANRNSRNQVFLCVFQHGKTKVKVKTEETGTMGSRWPLQRRGEKLPRL